MQFKCPHFIKTLVILLITPDTNSSFFSFFFVQAKQAQADKRTSGQADKRKRSRQADKRKRSRQADQHKRSRQAKQTSKYKRSRQTK